MTSRKGPLIRSVLQSTLRLISIHCNYSTCSGFGQHFPPQNGLSLKEWPTKENPKLPWDFLLWCTLLFLKAHLTYFSPQCQFKGLHSCSPKLSSLPLSTPSSSSSISGIHICWDLPQQWHAKRGPAGNPLGSTLAAITGDSPTLSAEKEPTLPSHRSGSVAAPEALQSPRGCFPGTNGDPHECEVRLWKAISEAPALVLTELSFHHARSSPSTAAGGGCPASSVHMPGQTLRAHQALCSCVGTCPSVCCGSTTTLNLLKEKQVSFFLPRFLVKAVQNSPQRTPA